SQNRCFFLARILFVGASNAVAALAGRAVTDEMIATPTRARSLDCFRIKAGEEQREIADVPMVLAASAPLAGERLGLADHVRYFVDRPAVAAAQSIDSIGMQESSQ